MCPFYRSRFLVTYMYRWVIIGEGVARNLDGGETAASVSEGLKSVFEARVTLCQGVDLKVN